MKSNIISLPASAHMTPKQTLASMQDFTLQDVLIIGVDNDDNLLVRSSRMTKAEAMWLLEKAKGWALKNE
jgi:hypothetical protein